MFNLLKHMFLLSTSYRTNLQNFKITDSVILPSYFLSSFRYCANLIPFIHLLNHYFTYSVYMPAPTQSLVFTKSIVCLFLIICYISLLYLIPYSVLSSWKVLLFFSRLKADFDFQLLSASMFHKKYLTLGLVMKQYVLYLRYSNKSFF